MLHIGLISVRGQAYHPTQRLMEAAARRGVKMSVIHPYRHPPGIRNGAATLCEATDCGRVNAVMPRQGAEIKTACLALIAHFEYAGIPVINGLRSVMMARHKFLAMQAFAAEGLPVPDTIYVGDRQAYADAVRQLGADSVVVKPIRGRQGSQVVRLRTRDPLPRQLQIELDAGRGLLVQAFIAPEIRQDYRLMVVGDQVVAAMALTPAEGEFRANYHLGGRTAAAAPTSGMIDAALRACKAVALDIAGVDLMVLRNGAILVVEANYAPGFRGLEQATGLDIAGRMIDYVLSRIRQARPEA